MDEKNLQVKKRMMFIKEEDYNFLTYNIFIILNGLGCTAQKGVSMKDHRKLSFLIDFISDSRLIDILGSDSMKKSNKFNELDRELLNQSYTNSLLRIKTINQLIFTLSNEGYIIVTNKKLDKLSITLNKDKIENDFFRGGLFSIERGNIKRLKNLVKRITILDIKNMLNELYYNYGVLDEQIIN